MKSRPHRVAVEETVSAASQRGAFMVDVFLTEWEDAERVIDVLHAAGKTAVIPPKANRKTARDFDKEIYKARHLIENFFADLTQYRAIATRYDKTARNFLAATYLVAAAIWLK
jgi:transposase